MSDAQKPTSAVPASNGRPHRPAALDRHFDHAAFDFFTKFNGEPPNLSLHDFLDRFERAVVFETLVRNNGSQKETAAILKVKKQTLNWKVKRQHILITKQISMLP
jgi:DNA-binding NtrC family response regulator